MFLMIVLSCFPLCVLDTDVNVPHDRADTFSYMCSRLGLIVPHDCSVMFSYMCSRYGR